MIEMIARMNLKRSQRILSKRRSDSSKEKKPFVNLQLTYYYLLIRQTGRQRGGSIQPF